MGTARALLSFYGVPDSATVGGKKKRHLTRELDKERAHRWHDRSGVSKGGRPTGAKQCIGYA